MAIIWIVIPLYALYLILEHVSKAFVRRYSIDNRCRQALVRVYVFQIT